MNYYISDDILLDDWTEEFLLERLELPRVWKTLNNGFEIQELKPSRVDEVIKIIKENYIFDEPLMVGCQMHTDKESVEQYLYLAQHWMMDTLSTVAVEQETGNVVGFLICRNNEMDYRDREFSKERVCEGAIWNKLHEFKVHMSEKGNAYAHYDVDKIFEIYALYVLPRYTDQGIDGALMKNAVFRQLVEFVNDDEPYAVLAGLFGASASQRVASSLGMETLYEMAYADWTVESEDAFTKEQFFRQIQPGNHSAKLMAIRIAGGGEHSRSAIGSSDTDPDDA